MNNYQDLLKDSRWQKKRLKIMNRDKFSCCVCGCGLDDGTTLNVHHISYKPGKKPWEYSDDSLITLCCSCHQKFHNGEVKLPKPKSKKNTIVYYKYLFNNDNTLSANEGIIYSTLLLHSLVSNDGFSSKNAFCINAVKDYLSNNEEKIPYYPLSPKELMDKTEMTFPTVKKAVTILKTKGYIEEECIRCPIELLQKGYLKIPKGSRLKGRQLVFYGFLLDRSNRHGSTLDTWAYRFKNLCGVDTDDAYFMIHQLKNKGLLERLKNGKLKVNKPG